MVVNKLFGNVTPVNGLYTCTKVYCHLLLSPALAPAPPHNPKHHTTMPSLHVITAPTPLALPPLLPWCNTLTLQVKMQHTKVNEATSFTGFSGAKY